jgi:YebC/PmpR family DNA-binding regulatory protein
MSGHSKWAGIKHKKAIVDAKRGKLFTKLIKEITVAAKQGGGDPGTNPRLRTAVQGARDANMPSTNIERAIKKGTGELPGVSYEEMTIEGYGPSGVAIMAEILTDNRNRTLSEIRHIFSKYNGNIGENGCVAWLFHKKGVLTFTSKDYSEERLIELSIEAGAEDFKNEGDTFMVTSSVEDFAKLKEMFIANGITPAVAEVTMIPKNTVKVDEKDAKQTLRLAEALEEHDDVQHTYSNFDIPDELLETSEK